MANIKKRESQKVYIYFLVAFIMIKTIDTFIVEAKWFDYVQYFFMLVAIGIFVFVHLKRKKYISGSIAGILFIWYLYGFNYV